MPQHGLVDESTATQLPVTQVPEEDLNEEKKLARFSKTEEFKRLKAYIESRIAYYQRYLPDGRDITTVKPDELGPSWVVANAMVGEFRALLDAYEQANEAVNAQRKR